VCACMLPYVHAEWAHTVEIEHIYLLSNALCAACQCVQCKCPHLPPSIQIPPAAAMGAEDKLNPDNLVTLEVLEEHTMLAALKGRYATGKIYTAVGDILLALNPFKQLPLYTDRIKGLYHPNKDPSAVPHVYSTALTVYQNLSLFGKNQCCLISGESGACPSFLSLSRSLSPPSLSPVQQLFVHEVSNVVFARTGAEMAARCAPPSCLSGDKKFYLLMFALSLTTLSHRLARPKRPSSC
jgi:hypothetical protein